MADLLYDKGKVIAMGAILTEIDKVYIATSVGGVLSETDSITPANYFSVNATSGVLSNSVAKLDFDIETGDIGETVSLVIFVNSTDDELLQIDLQDSGHTLKPVELTTAGTATFAIGDLVADL